jgi:endoglucanase
VDNSINGSAATTINLMATTGSQADKPITKDNEQIKGIAEQFHADPQKLADGVVHLKSAVAALDPKRIDAAVTEINQVLHIDANANANNTSQTIKPTPAANPNYDNQGTPAGSGGNGGNSGVQGPQRSAAPTTLQPPASGIDHGKVDALRETLKNLGIPPNQIDEIITKLEAQMLADLDKQRADFEAQQAAIKAQTTANNGIANAPPKIASANEVEVGNTRAVNLKSKGGAIANSSETYAYENKKLDDEIQRRTQNGDVAGAHALEEIKKIPVANWFSNGTRDEGAVKEYLAAANASGKTAQMTLYNIPQRDLGNYSAGGAGSADEYMQGIKMVANNIGDQKAEVNLEPDSLMDSYRMSPEQGKARRALLSQAVDTLSKGNTQVSLSAGSPGWPESVPQDKQISKVVDGLMEAGLGKAGSFTVGESSFVTTPKLLAYGNAIVKEAESRGIKGLTFKVDTSRNGADVSSQPGNMSWAEAPGAALGYPSIEAFKASKEYASLMSGPDADKYSLDNVSQFFSNKVPTEADGRIAQAGSFIPDYAIGMYNKAVELGTWPA